MRLSEQKAGGEASRHRTAVDYAAPDFEGNKTNIEKKGR
jgi:hypothetical protein